jgi:hypothetical protein
MQGQKINHLMQYPTRSGQTFQFDISRESCAPFGFYFGDRVKTPKKNKPAWVIGVWTSPQGQSDLWFHIDGDAGASHWDGFGKTDFERKGFKLLFRPGPEEKPEKKNPYHAPDLGGLLREETECFSDITFKVGAAYIKAHRAILCARSAYFRAMFTLGMRESSQNEIEITMDVDEASFRGMLHFLYTGNVDLNASNVFLLLVTAHKFQMDALSQLCYDHIDNQKLLSAENVIDVMQLAKEHLLNPLQSKCLEFILENYHSLKHKLDTLDKETLFQIMQHLEPSSRKSKDPSNTNLDSMIEAASK